MSAETMSPELLEVSLITAGGAVLNISAPPYTICESEGLGMAPFRRIGERSAGMHGERDLGFLLEPRTIRFRLKASAQTAVEHFQRRAELHRILRPSDDPVTLQLTLPGGEIRHAACHLQGGLQFRTAVRKGLVQETEILLRSPDPVFYDPQEKSVSWVFAAGGSMALEIPYTADWHTSPLIEISGPIDTPVLRNAATGELIRLDYSIAPTETVSIDFRTSLKRITNQAGTDLLPTLNPASDLGTFHLEANGGTNTFVISGGGCAPGTTRVVVRWRDQYIGI